MGDDMNREQPAPQDAEAEIGRLRALLAEAGAWAALAAWREARPGATVKIGPASPFGGPQSRLWVAEIEARLDAETRRPFPDDGPTVGDVLRRLCR